MTHTYAILEISQAAFDEIKTKLEAAGYQHAFEPNAQDVALIDMHGIALKSDGVVNLGRHQCYCGEYETCNVCIEESRRFQAAVYKKEHPAGRSKVETGEYDSW
jgi:hypothetical protein